MALPWFLKYPSQNAFRQLKIIRVSQFLKMMKDPLLRKIAQYACHRRTDISDDPIGIRQGNHIGVVFNQGTEALFTLVQSFFCLFSFSNILEIDTNTFFRRIDM